MVPRCSRSEYEVNASQRCKVAAAYHGMQCQKNPQASKSSVWLCPLGKTFGLRAMPNARPRFYLSSSIYAQKSPVVYDSSCHSSRYMQLIMFLGNSCLCASCVCKLAWVGKFSLTLAYWRIPLSYLDAASSSGKQHKCWSRHARTPPL